MRQSELPKVIRDLELHEQQFVIGHIQALGFTGYTQTEEEDGDLDQAFPGAGEFDDNWNVLYEIKGVISEEALQEIVDDCTGFLSIIKEQCPDAWAELEGKWNQGGVDFCFTRQGQGAGFWDGDWEHGDDLTKWSKTFGDVTLYVERDDPEDEDKITAAYLM